jgi:tetratricopeptide (TPR) repeat protein
MTEQFVALEAQSPDEQPAKEVVTPWYGYIMPLGLGALYLLFLWLDFSYANMTRWPWAPILSGGLLVAAGWGIWQLRHLSKPFRGLGNGLDWAALVWIIALVASTIFSHVPHRSHWYLTMALSYIAALYALSNWLDSKKKIENLTVFLVGSSLFFSCNSSFKYIFEKWLPLRGENIDPGLMLNSFPLGHQNLVAGFLVLTLPLAVGVAFYHKAWRRWLGIVTTLMGLIVMVSTGSRGGFLGLGTALVLSIIFALLIDWSWQKLKLAAGALVILLSLVGILISSNGNFRYRMGAIFTGQDLNILSRNWAWGVGLKEWQDNPWFGVGIGANPYTFDQYQSGMRQYPWSTMLFQQLHNSLIQVLAELGSLGGIAILITLGLIARLIWKLYQAKQLTILPASVFCGLTGYGLMSLTDYQLEVPAISMALVILVALLISFSKNIQTVSSWPENIRKGSTLLGFSLVAITVAFLIPIQRALYESEKGYLAYNEKNIPLFYEQLVKAISLDPNDPYYPLQLSLVMQKQGLTDENPKSQKQYYERGAFWATRAADQISMNYTYENAGWAFVHLRKYKLAEAFFRKNLAIKPSTRDSAYLGLGFSLLKQESKQKEGIEAFAKYLFLKPEYFKDKIWVINGDLSHYFLPITQELLSIYDEMLAKYPGDIDLVYGKSMVYYVRHDYANALSLLKSIPKNPKPLKAVADDGTTSLPYNLTTQRVDAAESCLTKEQVKIHNEPKGNKLDQGTQSDDLIVAFPRYDQLDSFMFRHTGGVPMEVIWPIFPDLSKYPCGPLSSGSTRFILPQQ